ncbi:MAG TPA: multicopper oxidase domain-containing protein [Thermoanaerobaculia bacterium]|nr:multicopper oxidase domain-containing protein [Thermoanaerobaculia bacterium]
MLNYLLPSLLLLSGAAVQAQNVPEPCPPPKVKEELRTVPELRAQGGELGTIFRVEALRACVPVYDPATQSWFSQPEMLRTYVYPDPARPSGEWSWGFPGPTLRVRRADPEKGIKGDRLTVYLTNNLSADLGGVCSPVCPAGTLCPRDPGTVQGFPQPRDCGNPNGDVRCCCYTRSSQIFPDCFHGDNTTNLHFHGSHVSPQAPQDYVLLELRPRRNHVYPSYDRGRGAVAHGDYRYRLDPFPANQAEGTHWYHPHKQGSISLQVANGMPGALIIEGPFDDELRNLYGGELTEKILFLQQIQGDSSLFNPAATVPAFLVNGQPQPRITLRPGEVQRWRFVNASLQAEAPVQLRFPEGVEARQIAMDGIQFAPENYERQPLLPLALSPGNRADFLVRAAESPASLSVPAAEGAPPLFFIEIEGEPVQGQKLPTKAQFPRMPRFLADIPESEVAKTNDLTFGMTFGPVDPRSAFFINDTQFDPSCVNVTTTLNTADAWKIRNTSALAHPFHIHTNPFQVVEVFDPTVSGQVRKLDPPYVWQDTIALPVAQTAGTATNPGWVHLRQRYLDFTGESVLHCQLHGDQGMMFAVQTVCKDKPDSFGKPRPNEAECVPNNFIQAAPVCPPAPPARP